MKNPLGFALCLGLLFTTTVPPAPDRACHQPSIPSLSADMQRAANAHDTDRFMVPFLHQPSLVFAFNGEVIHGWDALHAQQLKWWRNGKSDVVYTPTGDIQIMSLASDLAVSTQTLSSRRTLPNGKTSTGTFVVSYIWKKLPQGWQIVYGHESWSREDAGTKSK